MHHRVDANHSNIAAVWGRIRRAGQDWPDEDQWRVLRAADRLEPPNEVGTDEHGVLTVCFGLPMPAMSLLELTLS